MLLKNFVNLVFFDLQNIIKIFKGIVSLKFQFKRLIEVKIKILSNYNKLIGDDGRII